MLYLIIIQLFMNDVVSLILDEASCYLLTGNK